MPPSGYRLSSGIQRSTPPPRRETDRKAPRWTRASRLGRARAPAAPPPGRAGRVRDEPVERRADATHLDAGRLPHSALFRQNQSRPPTAASPAAIAPLFGPPGPSRARHRRCLPRLPCLARPLPPSLLARSDRRADADPPVLAIGPPPHDDIYSASGQGGDEDRLKRLLRRRGCSSPTISSARARSRRLASHQPMERRYAFRLFIPLICDYLHSGLRLRGAFSVEDGLLGRARRGRPP